MASLKKLMKTAQAPWTLTSFVRWWWAKLVQIYFKKAKKGIGFNHKPLALCQNPRSCDEVCCILLLFVLLHRTSLLWFIKAPKSLAQHTCTKNGSIFNPHLQCLLYISNTPYSFDYYTIKYFDFWFKFEVIWIHTYHQVTYEWVTEV